MRYSVNQRGDMLLIGNTLEYDCDNSPAPMVGTVGACGNTHSDTGSDVLWRSDEPSAGQATASSSIKVVDARSTAVLAVPAGATVTYARLYWAAATDSSGWDSTATLERAGAFSQSVTADDHFTVNSGSTHYYQSTADVTSLIQTNGPGAYRVGGVDTLDPVGKDNETNFAAWSLVVFYSLPSDPPRNLALFDGLDLVSNGHSASATVSGFLVPNTGYHAKLGVIAYEGDSTITGDSLQFNGVTLSDTLNPSNNFFNSTRSNLGAAVSVAGDLPQMSGAAGSMSGLDLDVVDVTGQLSAGATSATTKATSNQDTYLIGAFVTSISTLRPIFSETTKSYVDLNGGVIAPGDVIEYTLTTRNTGTDTAVNTQLDDPLPVGVTFVPGSLEIVQGPNAGVKTDAAGDDQADYDAATRTLHFRLGTGADATQGGSMDVGDPDNIVRFRVTVDATATGSIANQGTVTATGNIGGQTQTFPSSNSGSNGQPTQFVIAPDTTIVSGPPTNTTDTTATFNFSSDTASVTYECNVDGAGFAACANPLGLSGLGEGPHTLSVRAVLGGVSDPTPANYAWTVDDTAPDTFIVSGPPAISSSSSATFTFNSDETGVTYECSLDGGGYVACANPVTFSGLADGSHSLSARARDAAGNVDASPVSSSWSIDTTPPDTFIVSGPPALTRLSSADFDFSSNEAGVTYECSLDAGLYVPCSDPVTFPGLSDGNHTLAVRATDGAGNVDPSFAAWAWTVDSIAPDTTLLSGPPASTNVASATFTFSATEAGSTFECKLDSGAFSPCTSPRSYSGLSDGSHTFQVRATDAAGNVDASPASETWTIDSTPPDTSITSGPPTLTNATTATFDFNATEGATFECALDSGAFSPCASPQSYSGLSDGSHTFQVRATDAAGNVDASPASYTWTLDATAPNTSLVSGPPAVTSATSATFDFSSSEPGATFECSLDGAAFTPCTAPEAFTGLSDGSHTFAVRATDAAGNVDPSPATQTWTVDSVAPDTSIVSGPPTLTNSTSATFDFSASETGVTYECSLDGAAFTPCTAPDVLSGLTEGSHTFAVRATDAAGNVDASPATQTWTIDTTAPTTTIVSGPPTLTNATTATFDFSSSEPGATFECSLDGATFIPCSNPADFSGLAEGSHTLIVRARDAAGNVDTSPATLTWTVDDTAPDTTIVSGPPTLTNATTATFDFSASEPGSTFECSLDGAAFASCTTPDVLSGLTEGSHTFAVRATDAAGNVDASPATQTWTIDTTAPNTSIVSGPPTLTNATTATFDFSASETGVTYECSLDGAAFTPCTAPDALSGLADGSHTFVVRATDAAGNVDASPATLTWTVDATAPDTSIVSGPPALTNSTSATFDFDATEAGVTYECKLDTGAFTACSDPVTFSGLADGSHSLSVRAKDAAGNVDASPAVHTWTIDSATPDTSIVSGPPSLTNSTTALFDFDSNKTGVTYECNLDGAGFTACTDPATFSSLADGTHLLEVRARDAVGNVDPSPATQSWTVDTAAPDTSIVSGPPTLTNSTSATFDFDATEAGVLYECSLDSGTFDACTDPVTFTSLADGAHTLAVRARDAAGNADASPATYGWTVDASAPDTSIVSGPPSLTNVADATFDFDSTEAGVTFECKLDSGTFAACTNPVTFSGLSDGTHSLAVRARDAAGNVDASPATQSWTVDTAAPDTSIVSGPPALTNVVDATFDFDSTEGGSTFECSLDGAAFSACTDPVTFAAMADGAHTLAVQATDAAGNVDASPATWSWTVDATPPDTFVSGTSGLTNATSASFALSSNETGVTYECNLDGGGFLTCPTPVTFSGLADGPHTVSVRAIDAAGNVDATPAEQTWTVDATPPDTSIVSGPAALTNATDATFEFSASEAATFECSLDGGAFSSCTTPWVVSALADGSHTFAVRATDAAGNVDASPATQTWTVDATAPDTSITSGPSALTNSTSATFEFSATETATFECSLDGAAFAACTTPNVISGLADGSHTFAVRATDAAGNVDASPATQTWTVDATAPDTSIVSGPTALTNATSATFEFSASETGSTFECSLDGAAFSSCTTPNVLSGLADGSHTFAVRATDAAGNVDASPATQTWTVDATAPDTSIVSGPAALTNSTSATFEFSATETGATFECSLDGAAFASCATPNVLSGLADGSHTFAVRATDAAGNVDASPATQTWTVDATAPDTSIVSGPAALTNSTSATFDFDATEAGVTYECSLDSGAFTACTDPVTFSGLADGAHTLAVRATDAAGNTDASPATHDWTVDSTAPDAPVILTPPDGSTVRAPSVTLSGTAEANSTVALFLDGTQVATLTADGAGAFSFTPATLALGAHVATATSTDSLGNVSGSSAPDSFIFDPIDTTIVSGPPSLSSSSDATFDFSSNVATATFDCSLDGAPFATCTDPVTFSGLIDGAHLLAVRADDGVGDVDPSPATYAWTVKAHIPAAPLIVRPSEGEVVGTATPLIVGTAEANSTVTVVIDGAQVGTAPADSNGDWSLVTPSPLAAGGHIASASAKDASGHTGPFSAPRAFTVDLSVLDTFIVSGPSGLVSTDSATFDFDSNRSPVTYECALDGAAFTACANPATFDTLTDGPHSLSVRAKEAGGAVDTTPAVQQWTVTTIPPLAAPVITHPADGASVSTHTPTLEGTSTLGTTVAVRVDGADVGTAVTDGNGHWALALTTPLATGSHTADATATDLSSRVSPPSATITFTVDPTALDTFILSGPPPLVASASATFSFDASVLGATYQCSLDGAAFAACSNPVTFTGLEEGLHQLAVAASDALGDVDPSPAGWTWSVDTVAPTAPVITLPVDGSTLLFATPTIEGTAEAGAWVDVSVDGVLQGTVQADVNGTWILPPSTALADGTHVATATATDAAGNVSPQSAPDTFHVLTSALAAPTITVPANGATVRTTTPTIEGMAPAGSTVTVWIDGERQGVATPALRTAPRGPQNATVSAATAPADQAWSLVPPQPLSQGEHVVTAVAEDSVGRVSASSTPSRFTVDTVAPDTQVTSGPPATTEDTTADFTLASDDPTATFECSLDGAAFAPCTSPVHFEGLSQGAHTFEARAIDEAGNVDPTPAHVDWTIDQALVTEHTLNFTGGGCSTTPRGGATSLLLVVLAGLLGGWRRREGKGRPSPSAAAGLALVLGLVTLPGAARAQSQAVPGFDLADTPLELGSDNNLVFNTGGVLPQGKYRVSFGLELATQPLVLAVDAEKKGAVVGNRLQADLTGAYGLTDWLELGVSVPIVLHQGGDDLSAYGVASPRAAGGGTPWLRARVGLLTQDEQMPVDLAATVGLGLPIGSKSALAGSSGLGVDLGVGVGRKLNDWLRAGGQVGVLLRSSVDLGNGNPPDSVGSAVHLGGQLSTLNSGPRGEVALLLDVPVTHAPVSAELLFGGRMSVARSVELFALAGPGLGHAPGTPGLRALLGVAFQPPSEETHAAAPAPAPAAASARVVCQAGTPHRPADCPDLDDDQDGIPNKLDACPTQPEDKDGYMDQDGCPDPDNDGDGVLDGDDQCPLEPGPSDHHGCPVKDADKDGIEDAQDHCPNEPGDLAHQGCPAPVDTDGDGVPDAEDNCVNIPGAKSNQGCPAKQKQLVVIKKENLQILDKVYFSSGGWTIQKRSFRLLTQVADVVKGHPHLPTLEVQGHTDDRGADAKNLVLSQKRADAVRTFLIKKGVPPSRLTAKGYGETRPVETNKTARGREANRRVEFKFISEESPAAPE